MKNFMRFFLASLCFFWSLFFVKTASCDESFEKRKAIEMEWLKEISRVAASIGSDELNKISLFLNNNAVLGAPHQFGVRALEGGKKRSLAIIFVPVFEEDCKLSEEWSVFYRSDLAAQFFPDLKVIAINSRIKFSYLAKAMALAKEGHLAYAAIGINCKEGCDLYQSFIERDAQSFQNKLMDFWGGSRYRKLVFEEANLIGRVIKKNDNNGFFLPSPKKYDKRLSDIFAKPYSKEEESFWATSYWIHAVFIAIEKNTDGDAGEQKMLFLRSLYQE
ncbi:MAG: hypothetical protein WA064_02135 [Candidatus Moraniibacteriota bacterium]